jgi:catechol 2,3-dioxygenase-like lactoylglutathione lyase family enzyme
VAQPTRIEAQGQPVRGRLHVAFRADDRESVDRFHAPALEAGATDNGAPGKRAIYHAHYYGAYVLDPDGNNIRQSATAPSSTRSKERAALSLPP